MVNVFNRKIIEQKIKERKMSVSDFAKCINRSRTTVYDIFQRKSIDVDLLLVISRALEFDFLREIYLKDNNGPAEKKYYVVVEVDPSQLTGDLDMLFNKKLDGVRVLQKQPIPSGIAKEQGNNS